MSKVQYFLTPALYLDSVNEAKLQTLHRLMEWRVLMHISLQSDKRDLISNRAHGHFHVNKVFYI